MSLSSGTESFPATSTRRTFVNLSSSWALGYINKELEVSARDPEEVMAQLPKDVLLFRFYDRIVADVELGEESLLLVSDRMDFSAEQYFVDIKGVYGREQTHGWWKSNFYKDMRLEMDIEGTDHVVTWDNPHCCMLAYRPEVDVLLSRKTVG